MGRKRDAVVKTGKRLFLTLGIANTSMDQIAEAVPVSKMTLYNIFGSKEGLLEAVMDSIQEEGIRLFEQALEEASDPLDALNRVASIKGLDTEISAQFLKDMQAYPELLQRMVEAGAQDIMKRYEQIILEGQQLGQIRKDLSPIVIVAFLQSMRDFLSKTDMLYGIGSLETVGEQLSSILYHGIVSKDQTKPSEG